MRLVIFFAFFFVNESVRACAVPYSGEEFDSLIKIDHIKDQDRYVDQNLFIITIPIVTNKQYFSHAEITFYDRNDNLKVLEYNKKNSNNLAHLESFITTPLTLNKVEENMRGMVLVSIKSKLSFTINVSWNPKNSGAGACGTYAQQSLQNKI